LKWVETSKLELAQLFREVLRLQEQWQQEIL